jgi:hypothetical protein
MTACRRTIYLTRTRSLPAQGRGATFRPSRVPTSRGVQEFLVSEARVSCAFTFILNLYLEKRNLSIFVLGTPVLACFTGTLLKEASFRARDQRGPGLGLDPCPHQRQRRQ